MRHAIPFFLIIALMEPIVVKAFPGEKPRETVKGWGDVVDPDGDCKVALKGDKLTIAVPPTRHDLSVEVGTVNAPRILRSIEGDFIIQVKVSGNVRHAGNRTSDEYLAYHGAGLLLWQDGKTYIRLERAAIVSQDGSVVHYATLQLREDGKLVHTDFAEMEIPDRDTYLRIERRGSRILGSVSQDGVRWSSLGPLTVKLNKNIKIGMGAINTSTEAFKAEFSEREIFKKDS